MSEIGNHIVGLMERDAYRKGYEAHDNGKHLIVPEQYAIGSEDNEAWTLGWNNAWMDGVDGHD